MKLCLRTYTEKWVTYCVHIQCNSTGIPFKLWHAEKTHHIHPFHDHIPVKHPAYSRGRQIMENGPAKICIIISVINFAVRESEKGRRGRNFAP